MKAGDSFVMGAVAYDPKVVTIWNGFRTLLREQGLAFDYVLYSNYERQVEDLVGGTLHAAWNSPLAWLRATRLAGAQGVGVLPVFMRDTDRDLTSVVVTLRDGEVRTVSDLKGKRIGTGAVDSPQATLLPLLALADEGVSPETGVVVRGFDVGMGLHGDHVIGEREAARALTRGEVDAACLLDANHLLFSQDGTLPPGTVVIAVTPPYDHCNMTVRSDIPAEVSERFRSLFLSMDPADPLAGRQWSAALHPGPSACTACS